jgi:hypothetical protein
MKKSVHLHAGISVHLEPEWVFNIVRNMHLKRMAQVPAINGLQNHLQSCYEPLLTTPWILDVGKER